MTIMIINAPDPTETERQLLAAISQSEEVIYHHYHYYHVDFVLILNEWMKEGEYGMVIDGYTLQYALEPGRNLRLLQLAKRCAAVICCRVSPLQKVILL